MMPYHGKNARRLAAVAVFCVLLLAGSFTRLSALDTVLLSWNPADKTATLAIGSKDGVRAGDRFNIFAPEKVVLLPFSGGKKVLEIHEPIAVLTVKEVTLSTAAGPVDLVKDEYASLLRKGCIARRIETKQEVNRPPSLTRLVFSAPEIYPGSVVKVSVEYDDPNGDRPVFRWSAPGAYLRFPTTHFPWNVVSIPLDYSKSALTVTVTADDRRENGSSTSSFEKPVVRKPFDIYLNSQYQEVRSFRERFAGDRFNVDDVAALPDGGIVLLDASRQRALLFFDARMNLRFKKEVESAVELTARGGALYLLQSDKYSVLDLSGEVVKEVFFDDTKLNSYVREPVGIGVKANGDVMVIDNATKQIKVFSKEGYYRLSFGVAGQNPGAFLSPTAVAEDRFGNIMVLDSQRGDIQVFTPTYEVKTAPVSVSSLPGPTDMTYDPVLHRIYVLGSGGRILEINAVNPSDRKYYEPESGTFSRFHRTPDGVFYIASTVDRSSVLQRYIPGKGAAWYSDDNFLGVEDVACDAAGNIYLLCPDYRGAMVRVLDPDGWYFASLVPRESDAYGNIRYPVALEVSPDGRTVYLLDEGKRALEFSADGAFRHAYDLEHACSAAVDGAGRLYVLCGREGKVYECSNGNAKLVCSVEDSRTAKRCSLLEVSKKSGDIFIANTRNYKIFHFTGGNFMQPFPPGKSNFKRFRSLCSNPMDLLFVLDDRQVITPLYRGDVGLLAGPETEARGGMALASDGCGKLVVLDKKGLKVLRPAFLDND